MNVLSAASISASALDAEKLRLDVVSQNIANAHTTRDVNGQPYQRKVVTFQAVLDSTASKEARAVAVGEVKGDSTPGIMLHQPEHPHADAEGMVRMPNVNVAHEMVDLITATRAYEANLAVVRNARQMAAQALSIGR